MLGLSLLNQALGLGQQLPAAASSNYVCQEGAVSSLMGMCPLFLFSVCVVNRKDKANFPAALSCHLRVRREGFSSGTADCSLNKRRSLGRLCVLILQTAT